MKPIALVVTNLNICWNSLEHNFGEYHGDSIQWTHNELKSKSDNVFTKWKSENRSGYTINVHVAIQS